MCGREGLALAVAEASRRVLQVATELADLLDLDVDGLGYVRERPLERFADELAATGDAGRALERTVTGTGGALLSSAVTTAAGFGVLAFSLLPALRQFGLVLALGIAYAFLASVVVQPSLLALWARYGAETETTATTPAPGDD